MEKHNGWSNYPTWLVYTTLTNNEWSYKITREICKDEKYEGNIYKIAGAIKRAAIYDIEEMTSDITTSLLMWTVTDVIDWEEIAKAFVED